MSERIEVTQRCPTCTSPSPELHPAMQHEGEVEICKDAWHGVPPTSDWKPVAEERVLVEAVVNEVWLSSDVCTLELKDRVARKVFINVPLSSIRPMPRKEGE